MIFLIKSDLCKCYWDVARSMIRIMDWEQTAKRQILASLVIVLLHEHFYIISVHLFFLHLLQTWRPQGKKSLPHFDTTVVQVFHPTNSLLVKKWRHSSHKEKTNILNSYHKSFCYRAGKRQTDSSLPLNLTHICPLPSITGALRADKDDTQDSSLWTSQSVFIAQKSHPKVWHTFLKHIHVHWDLASLIMLQGFSCLHRYCIKLESHLRTLLACECSGGSSQTLKMESILNEKHCTAQYYIKLSESPEEQLFGTKVKIICSYSCLSLVCFVLFSALHVHKMGLHSKKHSSQDAAKNKGENGTAKLSWGKREAPTLCIYKYYLWHLSDRIKYLLYLTG